MQVNTGLLISVQAEELANSTSGQLQGLVKERQQLQQQLALAKQRIAELEAMKGRSQGIVWLCGFHGWCRRS